MKIPEWSSVYLSEATEIVILVFQVDKFSLFIW